MSSSSQRPVYIPKKRRMNQASNISNSNNPPERPLFSGRKRPPQQQQPRFHGAFTGGFSAGHFNTVATKEGWTPSTTKKTHQQLEDFMDEEDHAEWGGPTRIREDFAGLGERGSKERSKDTSQLASSSAPLFGLETVLEIKHETVGPRLLRRLGWREGGTVFVPDETSKPVSSATANDKEDDDAAITEINLSKKRVRRLQLQTSRTKLPPPKLDQCGLGFEPYQDAPEFQRYRERRKQQAQERATYNQRDNVYRISDVAGQEEAQQSSRSKQQSGETRQQHEYMSYETAEDFVGKRSSAGFALRDDEDDTYDNQQSSRGDRAQKVTGTNLGDEYNTEVYEHESSDDEIHHSTGGGKTQSLPTKPRGTNLFAAWAGGGDNTTSGTAADSSNVPSKTAMTSSGQTPLPGFVLGSSMSSNTKRYPGPDIPREYETEPHQFGENEHPDIFQTISRAIKLQQEEESQIAEQKVQQQQQQQQPMSSNFTSLADAMKSRFTSASSNAEKHATHEQAPKHPAGLYLPDPIEKKPTKGTGDFDAPEKAVPSVTVTRTVVSFLPEPLLCKRFGVPVPSHVDSSAVAVDARKKESTYFEQEILSTANKSRQDEQKSSESQQRTAGDPANDTAENENQPEGISRPSIEKLQAIFDAESDASSSEEEGETKQEESEPTGEKDGGNSASEQKNMEGPSDGQVFSDVGHELVEYQPRTLTTTNEDAASSDRSEEGSSDSESSSQRRRKKKKKSRKKDQKKKRKRRRSRSPSSDDDKERVSRRKKKKEKKQKKQSS